MCGDNPVRSYVFFDPVNQLGQWVKDIRTRTATANAVPHAGYHEKPRELLCAEKTMLLPYDVPVVTHRFERADPWIAPAVIQDQLPTAIQERGQVGIGCRRPAAIEKRLGLSTRPCC